MMNKMSSKEEELRGYLKASLYELDELELLLEQELQQIELYIHQNNVQEENPCNEASVMSGEENPSTITRPPSKLNKEKEKELIEALEKAKLALNTVTSEETDMDYRPEGMFPALPRPLSKHEKAAQLQKAYGLPPPKPAKKIVKPSESKYSIKNPGSKKPIARNPEKITTQKTTSAGMGSGTRERSMSRGKMVETAGKQPEGRTGGRTAGGKNSEGLKVAEGLKRPPLPEAKAGGVTVGKGSKESTQDTGKETAEQDNQQGYREGLKSQVKAASSKLEEDKPESTSLNSSPVKASAEAKSGPSPFLACLSRLVTRETIGMKEIKMLNSLKELDQKVEMRGVEYMKNKQMEYKRQNMKASSFKYVVNLEMHSMAMRRILNAERSEEAEVKYPLPEITVCLLDPSRARIEQFQDPLRYLRELPASLVSLDQNPDLALMQGFHSQNYFDTNGETFRDLIKFLREENGLKSYAGQTLMGELYSCWFFSEEFVTTLSELKQLKQSLEEGMAQAMGLMQIKEVASLLKGLTAANGPQDAKVGNAEDKVQTSTKNLERRLKSISNEYFRRIDRLFLTPLISQFEKLRQGERLGKEELWAFLKEVQNLSFMISESSKMPLIFHRNNNHDTSN